MSSKPINRSAISLVAKALGEKCTEMIFVGGAVVGLYADNLSDLELRETFDIDLTNIELISYSSYSKLLEELAKLGFHPDPEGQSI